MLQAALKVGTSDTRVLGIVHSQLGNCLTTLGMLELAIQHKTHADTVLAYRQKYLQQTGKSERDPRFLQYADKVEIDWDAIKAKKQQEKEKEARRSKGGGGSGK